MEYFTVLFILAALIGATQGCDKTAHSTIVQYSLYEDGTTDDSDWQTAVLLCNADSSRIDHMCRAEKCRLVEMGEEVCYIDTLPNNKLPDLYRLIDNITPDSLFILSEESEDAVWDTTDYSALHRSRSHE